MKTDTEVNKPDINLLHHFKTFPLSLLSNVTDRVHVASSQGSFIDTLRFLLLCDVTLMIMKLYV